MCSGILKCHGGRDEDLDRYVLWHVLVDLNKRLPADHMISVLCLFIWCYFDGTQYNFYHCGIYHTYGLVDPTSMNCFAKTFGYLNATLTFCLEGTERQEIKYTCIVKKMQHFILDQEDTYM